MMLHLEKQQEILYYCRKNSIRAANLEYYLTNPEICYCYAIDILKGRFELAEPSISKDSHYSYLYAKNILKGRFELGEPAIKNGYFWGAYCDVMSKLGVLL